MWLHLQRSLPVNHVSIVNIKTKTLKIQLFVSGIVSLVVQITKENTMQQWSLMLVTLGIAY